MKLSLMNKIFTTKKILAKSPKETLTLIPLRLTHLKKTKIKIIFSTKSNNLQTKKILINKTPDKLNAVPQKVKTDL